MTTTLAAMEKACYCEDDYTNAVCLLISQGHHTVIDVEDYDEVVKRRWSASKTKYGYIYATRSDRIGNRKKTVGLARILIAPPPGIYVDHKNGNTLDNRRCNLRPATPAENRCNSKPSTSHYVGVTFVNRGKLKKKYRAEIKPRSGMKICLGYFLTAEEAAYAWNQAAIKIHGEEFARLNVINHTTNKD